MPGRRPARSAMRRYLLRCASAERLVRRLEDGRSSRSSSRRGTAGRSRCPGRSARRCSGGCRRGVAPRAMSDRAPHLERHAPPAARQRERVAVERRDLEQRRQVGAGPAAVHVRLAGARLAAQHMRHDGAPVVEADLARGAESAIAEDMPRAVGQDDREAADPEPSAAARGRPSSDTLEQRWSRRSDADRARRSCRSVDRTDWSSLASL